MPTNDITARIAAIVGHWLEDYARDADTGYDCSCGRDYRSLDTAHVAAVLVAELGLYEEVDSAGRRSMRCDSRWEFPTITESGKAVVESGLTTRQAHELRTGCSPENQCDDCRDSL